MAIRLYNYQLDAIDRMKNGCILCGGVGSGKSRTAIGYYLFKECQGDCKVIEDEDLPFSPHPGFKPMKYPRDLYIITTAKKRDSHEWDLELNKFVLSPDQDSLANAYHVQITIDSWNNIKKYKNIFGAFFIFDEQRVVGSGAWVKTFLNIARKNHWILLSATPGDSWNDYIPVFVANGFYRNKTDFTARHAVYSRYSKFPKIERYVDERILEKHRDSILVTMEDIRMTKRHKIEIFCQYDSMKMKQVTRYRWDPYDDCPIEETGKLFYLMRRVVNSDPSRIIELMKLIDRTDRLIVFYNFNYELEAIKMILDDHKEVPYAEWNGKVHQEIPNGDRWVYLVQYAAGCEGWNCTSTDTMVFFSQNYSYRMTEQAAGRIDRVNTKYKDLKYFYLLSRAPIDMAIRRALNEKRNFNERGFMK